MNIATLLEGAAQTHPGRIAVVCGEDRLTYDKVNRRVNRLANGLAAAGIRPGDAVAVTCPSRPEFIVIYYAILKIGAVAVPLNPLLKEEEIEEQLRVSNARMYLCFEGSPEWPMGAHGLAAFNKTPGCAEFRAIPASEHGATILAGRALWNDLFEGRPDTFDSVACDSSQSASITFTSGTTGAPKGAEHTHGSEYFIALAVRHEHDMKPGEIVLAPVPLFSSYRFSVLHTTCLTRSTLVILPRFDPVETWRAIQREKVEVMYAVSTMLHRMRDAIEAAGVNLEAIARHWRLCVSGSTPLLPDVHRFFNQALGVKIHVPYGATEVMLATILSEPVPLEACSIGKPVEHVLVRIVDDAMKEVPQGGIGEIVVRSAMRMKGYFNDPETTRHSFSGDWFHTGDLGYEDAEGTFHLAGRIKEMINRNGFKVYPLHVEKVLSAHPAVALAAVVGIPDVSVGEEVKAYVVLKPGAACSKEELTAWTKERVAAYAYPRIVEFRDSLPLARYGTVVKHLLRASSPGAVAETPAPEN